MSSRTHPMQTRSMDAIPAEPTPRKYIPPALRNKTMAEPTPIVAPPPLPSVPPSLPPYVPGPTRMQTRSQTRTQQTQSQTRKYVPPPQIQATRPATKAGVIVIDPTNHKVLTISNEWDQNIGLPKGSIEPGESNETAAFRELREETGLDLSPTDATEPPLLMSIYQTAIAWYVVRIPNASITYTSFTPQQAENIGFVKWRTLEELQEAAMNKHTNQTIANKQSIKPYLLQLLGDTTGGRKKRRTIRRPYRSYRRQRYNRHRTRRIRRRHC